MSTAQGGWTPDIFRDVVLKCFKSDISMILKAAFAQPVLTVVPCNGNTEFQWHAGSSCVAGEGWWGPAHCPSGSWVTTHIMCLPFSRKGLWLNKAPVLQSGSREEMSWVALDYDVHCQAEVNTNLIQILYKCLLVNACSLWDAYQPKFSYVHKLHLNQCS